MRVRPGSRDIVNKGKRILWDFVLQDECDVTVLDLLRVRIPHRYAREATSSKRRLEGSEVSRVRVELPLVKADEKIEDTVACASGELLGIGLDVVRDCRVRPSSVPRTSEIDTRHSKAQSPPTLSYP